MKFESFKNARVVRSSWLEEGGRRLDCNPYMSGALEARDALKRLNAPKEKLKDVTTGIFHAGRESRLWVDSPEYGVPFLGSSDILNADLSTLPLISKKRVQRNPRFILGEKWTLITRSGTIGRMAYVRPDMAGLACSEDVLRVVPDESRIPPGYLYAFLSSKYGVPLVVSGTYGAIIQHIEPEHIANLPVPRFGVNFELKIDELVNRAANLLSAYQLGINQATAELFRPSAIPNPSNHEWWLDKSDLGFIISASKAEPLRAWNHSLRITRIKDTITQVSHSQLGDLVDHEWLKWRVMFKRIDVPPEYGIEIITQRPLFQLFPSGRWISRNYLLNHSPKYVVPDRTILIAKQGTLGEDELYCRCEFITGTRALERAYSDHCMRLVIKDKSIEPGYLFAFLRSNTGFRLLRSLSEGSKQQDLHWRTVPTIPIPRLNPESEIRIAELIYQAYDAKNCAVELYEQATKLIEEKIEGSN